MQKLLNKQQGFTIIELLVVIVIIGILVALLLPNLFSAQQRARDTDRKSDLSAVQQQLEAYYNDNNNYPGPDWAAMATALEDGGYLDEAPEDPQDPTRQYAYAAEADDGSACTTAAEDCVRYTLTANLENENDPATEDGSDEYIVDSVNQ